MKIAFLHRDLPPDSFTGVATQVHRLAQALSEMGESVDVFTMTTPDEGRKTGYRIRTIELPGLRNLLRLAPQGKRLWHPFFFRALDFSGYDVVHIHGDGAFLNYGPHWARTFYGSASLERRFGSGLKSFAAQTMSWLGEKRESKACRHQSAIASHIRHVLPTVTEVIPCMLAEPVATIPPRKSTRPTLLHVGALGGRKRGYEALKLWRKLREHGQAWHLHLVCPASDAATLTREQLGEDVSVHTSLNHSALQKLYAESWVALSLARYEGFGLSIIEALAQGCLPLSTPHQGAMDILGNSLPESLVELGNMPDRLLDLGRGWQAGHPSSERLMRLARPYEPTAIARLYLSWYHRIIEKPHPGQSA
jgi:phosphatidyl-myo-inositol alpha-mannosyltransferase